MTDAQLAYFMQVWTTFSGTLPKRAPKRLFALAGTKTPAQIKDALGFSYLQIARVTGYSKSHIANCVLEGRRLTPVCLEAWRDIKRQAVKLGLGAEYGVKFDRRSPLAGEITLTCPVCGRVHVVAYKGASSRCHYHRGR